MRRFAASSSATMTQYATVRTAAGTAMIQVMMSIAISLARGTISAWHSIRTLHNLPQLVAACAEYRRRRRQIEPPHAVEPLVVVGAQARPRLLEIVPPSHQRRVIIGAEVLPI